VEAFAAGADSMMTHGRSGGVALVKAPAEPLSTSPSIAGAGGDCPRARDVPGATPAAMPGATASGGTGLCIVAHHLGLTSSALNVVCGLCALAWSNSVAARPAAGSSLFALPFCGPYCVTIGFLGLLFEYFLGLSQVPLLPGEHSERGRSPVRAVLYLVLAIPTVLSYPTLLATFAMLLCSVANAAASARGECVLPGSVPPFRMCGKCQCLEVDAPRGAAESTAEEAQPLSPGSPAGGERGTIKDAGAAKGVRARLARWWQRLVEIGYTGQALLVALLALANAWLFFARLAEWEQAVSAAQATCQAEYQCLSRYAPWAKAFGQTLNLNSALLVVPVLKSLVLKLHELEMRVPADSCARLLMPPLRKNVLFHVLVALLVLGGAAGHVVFHLLNLAVAPEVSWAAFPTYAWVTGFLVSFCLVVIYPAAQHRVRRADYELFWGAHHAGFVPFFLLMLAHAPHFWLWGGVPLLAYLAERLYRLKVSREPFYVSRVVLSRPVLCLSFFPARPGAFAFREGMYVYVLVPGASRHEWHPFTISSACEDLERRDGEMTLHIKVHRPGSWTHRVCELFERIAPAAARTEHGFALELRHVDSTGASLRGKLLGPDGQPLLLVDGPYAAPAMHYAQYREVLLVGAGIGITPSSAILQSVLRHKWKKGFPPQTIYFCLVVRHDEITSFRWFLKLLVELEALVAGDHAAGNLDAAKNRLEVHIFVTQAPKRGETVQRQPSLPPLGIAPVDPARAVGATATTTTSATAAPTMRAGPKVQLGFGHQELELAMLNPTTRSDELARLLSTEAASLNRMRDMYVWNGRPPWESIFARVRERRHADTREIAVCFCGTPAIGKDLRALCNRYSSDQDKLRMVLLKETF
jgi:NAD(P)H-flavin reductase